MGMFNRAINYASKNPNHALIGLGGLALAGGAIGAASNDSFFAGWYSGSNIASGAGMMALGGAMATKRGMGALGRIGLNKRGAKMTAGLTMGLGATGLALGGAQSDMGGWGAFGSNIGANVLTGGAAYGAYKMGAFKNMTKPLNKIRSTF